MINICDFIKANIEIRKYELTGIKDYNINKKCLNLLTENNSSLLSLINANNPDNFDIIYRISSKSFESTSRIISNRLEGLSSMLVNINYKTGDKFNNIEYMEKYKYFLVSFYIVAGQIFSDANHRVCYQYLLYQGLTIDKISRIIKTIDLSRRNKYIDWDNIHDFIQKLIDNLISIINQRDENILLEKIENLFI
jgi:hypothetical protein